MNEIDLFPDDLRRKLLFMRWLKWSGLALALFTLASMAGFAWLYQHNQQVEAKIQKLQQQRAITTSSRNQLEQYSQQKKQLQQQLDLLMGLRSGASAEQMFVAIDEALPSPEVWLTSWKFRRAGTPVDEREKSYTQGYFIVIPQGSKTQKEETWKIETNMNLQGQAIDHAAMSRFVLNLTRSPGIEAVRIIRSQQSTVNQVKLVDFTLDIIVSASRETS